MQNLLLVRGRLNLRSRFPCYVDIVKTSHVDDFGLLSVLVYVFRIFDKANARLKCLTRFQKYLTWVIFSRVCTLEIQVSSGDMSGQKKCENSGSLFNGLKFKIGPEKNLVPV